MGTLTSWNPLGHSRLVKRLIGRFLFQTSGTSEKNGWRNASISSVAYDHIEQAQNCLTELHYNKQLTVLTKIYQDIKV